MLGSLSGASSAPIGFPWRRLVVRYAYLVKGDGLMLIGGLIMSKLTVEGALSEIRSLWETAGRSWEEQHEIMVKLALTMGRQIENERVIETMQNIIPIPMASEEGNV